MGIGVFGGTFDPPHIGHLVASLRCIEALGLSKVIFVPCFVPPHKLKYPISPYDVRVKMVKLAIQGVDEFEVSRIEEKLPTPSYTVNTLEFLRQRYNDLFLLVGTDQAKVFSEWHDYERLFDLAKVVVFPRGGTSWDEVPSWVKERVQYVDFPPLVVSATYIRCLAKEGKSLKFLVPPLVEAFVRENNLYKEGNYV